MIYDKPRPPGYPRTPQELAEQITEEQERARRQEWHSRLAREQRYPPSALEQD